MKKIVSVLGVLALFGACNSNDDAQDDTVTGGNAGASTKGGSGGQSTAGKGGGGASSFGGKQNFPGGAGSGSGGEVSQAGMGPIETGGAGGSIADTAGAGGLGGAGGTSDLPPEPVPSTDTCADAEATPNNDRTSATPFRLGTSYTACLQGPDDVDVYSFEIPQDSRGGYVTVSINEVGPDGDISVSAYTAADNGRFYKTGSNTEGAAVYAYFTAKPGAKFYLPVTHYLDNPKSNPYTLTVLYHQVPDVYEPNDLRNQAKQIAVGTPVEAYLFAGREYSTAIPDEDWLDWYKVDLVPGTLNVLLSPGANDIDGNIVLYDPDGVQIATKGSNTEGSAVKLTEEITTAGTYYLKISPYEAPQAEGDTATVRQYFRLPYTLTVTQ
ncbi:MAG TPA: hypothetical protein VFQ35_07895 [Polyangiaceae bacterium]|nr:hypothetical protein [Polyangiaceae bacterium]